MHMVLRQSSHAMIEQSNQCGPWVEFMVAESLHGRAVQEPGVFYGTCIYVGTVRNGSDSWAEFMVAENLHGRAV